MADIIMINYEELEDRIKNCTSEKELLIIEDELYELTKKHPEADLDNLFFLITDRKKYLQNHTCDPWGSRKQKKFNKK